MCDKETMELTKLMTNDDKADEQSVTVHFTQEL